MGLRAKKADQFRAKGVAERVAPYDVSHFHRIDTHDTIDDDVVERAATLLLVMPRQRRETIEKLVSPHDSDRGRAAVDALIEAAFVAEDDTGHLRRVG